MLYVGNILIAVSHAEAVSGLPKLALIPMFWDSYYNIFSFRICRKDIASAPFGIVIIFLQILFPLLWLVILQGHSL
jgi:hypothetical protein